LTQELADKAPERLVRGYNSPRLRVRTENDLPSRTDQSQKDECDINNIVERFQQTGIIEHLNTQTPQFGDATQVPGDFTESMHMIMAAQEMFDELPSDVRKFFDNDPQSFLTYAQDPSNAETLVELGLATPRNNVAQTATQSVSDAQPETSAPAEPTSPAA
jgi:phage internal scaffolding protein